MGRSAGEWMPGRRFDGPRRLDLTLADVSAKLRLPAGSRLGAARS